MAELPPTADSADMRVIERFFLDAYGPCMATKLRLIPLVLFSGYFLWSVSWALKMEPPVSRELWFPGSHMMERYQARMGEFFGGDQVNYRRVDLVWGIEGVDRSELNRWVPYNEEIRCGPAGDKPSPRGCVVWDDGLKASTHAAQRLLQR